MTDARRQLEYSEKVLQAILSMNRRERRQKGWRRTARHYRRQLVLVVRALSEEP